MIEWVSLWLKHISRYSTNNVTLSSLSFFPGYLLLFLSLPLPATSRGLPYFIPLVDSSSNSPFPTSSFITTVSLPPSVLSPPLILPTPLISWLTSAVFSPRQTVPQALSLPSSLFVGSGTLHCTIIPVACTYIIIGRSYEYNDVENVTVIVVIVFKTR